MSVPSGVRLTIRQRLWAIANGISWQSLPANVKTAYYEGWVRDVDVGGTLVRYMEPGRIRVYLKDTIMRDYGQSRLADHSRVFRVLRIPKDAAVGQTYVKPHGRRLADGRVICWGRADDWKNVLMAVHERSSEGDYNPFAAALAFSMGKYYQAEVRAMVFDAATKLGIEKLVWLDV